LNNIKLDIKINDRIKEDYPFRQLKEEPWVQQGRLAAGCWLGNAFQAIG